MQRYFDHIEALNEISGVLDYTREVFFQQGAVRMSYYVTPIFDEPDSQTAIVYTSGFEEDWLERYEREDFLAIDPVPLRVLKNGSMMTWAEARDAAPNTQGNIKYFAAMEEHGLIHGAGIPLFGPRGRDAFAAFDFDKPISEVNSEALGVVRSIAQIGHQRICVLLDQETPLPNLSERELEVLTWSARGKSTAAIATILGLSPDTVKTYSKRIYAKLEVSDRVGAVVKALRMGLVRI